MFFYIFNFIFNTSELSPANLIACPFIKLTVINFFICVMCSSILSNDVDTELAKFVKAFPSAIRTAPSSHSDLPIVPKSFLLYYQSIHIDLLHRQIFVFFHILNMIFLFALNFSFYDIHLLLLFLLILLPLY